MHILILVTNFIIGCYCKSYYYPNIGTFIDLSRITFYYRDHHIIKYRYSFDIPNIKIDKFKCKESQDTYNNMISLYYNEMVELLSSLPNIDFEKSLNHFKDEIEKLDIETSNIYNDRSLYKSSIKTNISDHEEDDLAYRRFKRNNNVDHPRNKRFIAPLLFAAGTAFGSILSTYSIHQTHNALDQIRELKRTFKYVENKNNIIYQKIQIHDKILHEFISSINHTLSNIKEVFDCESESLYFHIIQERITRELRDNFMSLSDATKGRVTRHFIPPHIISKILTSSEILKKSIFSSDPGLFYSTSTSIYAGGNLKTRNFDFIILVPMIQEKKISPIFTILNLGYISDRIKYSLNLPREVMLIGKRRRVFEYNNQDCHTVGGLSICDINNMSYNKKTICVESILKHNDTSNCDLFVQSDESSEVVSYLSSGLLIYGKGEVNVMDNTEGKQFISKRFTIDGLKVIPYNEFSSLIFKNVVYHSRNQYEEIHYNTDVNINNRIIKNINLDIPTITNIESVPSMLNDELNEENEYFGYQITTWVVCFLLIILIPSLIYVFYIIKYKIGLRKDLRTDLKDIKNNLNSFLLVER